MIMTIVDYIVLSLAIGVDAMVAMRPCAEQSPVRLVKGLLLSLCMGVVYVALMSAGVVIANRLRFDLPEVDKMICLGFIVLVAVKMLLGLKKEPGAYDITRFGVALLMDVARGINVLLIGLGVGFVGLLADDFWKYALPMLGLVSLSSMWGIMLGRKKVAVRHRRWKVIAVLCLLVIAIRVAV